MNKSFDLLKKDLIMKKLIESYELKPWPEPDFSPQFIFSEIIENILGQQLSGKAANTIIGRFKDLFGGKMPEPEKLLEIPDEKIRAVGTSWSKAKYVKNVAQAAIDKKLDLENFQNLSDEEIMKELVAINGIGPWTAEMLLMFTFRREDIFSTGDMGIQNAMLKHYKVKKGDSKKMLKIAENWRPYRTTACRILWRSLD